MDDKEDDVLLKTFVDWSKFTVLNDHIWEKSKFQCKVCSISAENAKGFPCKPSFVCSKSSIHETKHFFIEDKEQGNICFICKKQDLKLHKSKSDTNLLKNLNKGEGLIKENLNGCNNLKPRYKIFLKCLWCQTIIHDDFNCLSKFNEIKKTCDFGFLSNHIIHPSMIVFKPENDETDDENTKIKKNKNFEIHLPEIIPTNFIPIIVFLNFKSGSQSADHLYTKFLRFLNPRQVFTLPHDDPTDALNFYKVFDELIILVCGGDGSISWISNVISSLDMANQCTLSPLPLGTGNDFCQALDWGKNLPNPKKFQFLRHVKEIKNAKISDIDIWNIDIQNTVKNSHLKTYIRNSSFINYLSIGADAKIALNFDEKRNEHPGLFQSRAGNFFAYVSESTRYFFNQSYRNLYSKLKIFCDHEDMTEKLKSSNAHIILLININSYASGFDPWITSGLNEFKKQAIDDGLIEVLGLSVTHLPKLALKMSGFKIAQCKHVRIVTNEEMHMQADGEPYLIGPSQIKIQRQDQLKVFIKSRPLKELASCSDFNCSSTTNLSDTTHLEKRSREKSLTDLTENVMIDSSSEETNFGFHLNMCHLMDLFRDKETIQNIIQRYLSKDSKAEKSLIEAINNKEHKTILYILNNVKNLNLDYRDELGNTPLHYAASSLDVYSLSVLLINGANPYLKNNAGESSIKIIKCQPKSSKILSYIKRVLHY